MIRRNPTSEVDDHFHRQQLGRLEAHSRQRLELENRHRNAQKAIADARQNIVKRSSHHPRGQLNGRDLDQRDLVAGSTAMTLAQGINGLQKAGNLGTKSITTRYSAGSKILNNMAISSVIIELVPKKV